MTTVEEKGPYCCDYVCAFCSRYALENEDCSPGVHS